MDNEVFDSVKFEKNKAIARYNRFQNMMKMLQIFEVFVGVALISWSWTRIPTVVKISGEFLVKVTGYLFKPHIVFLLGNAIIVAIVVLCRQTDAGANNSVGDDDVLNEEIHHTDTSVQQQIVNDLPDLSPASLPEIAEPIVAAIEDKQIVLSECKAPEIQWNDMDTAIDTATKQIQKFKRTQSEKLKKQITTNPLKELRRSETDRRTIVPVEGVDTLSNEEFRLTIEAFIKKNQIFFEKQRLAENEPEKYERIGIEAF
ncbi:hypothetical protein BC332_32264 [Capsicum chinense]|nr:hypothetical protein BC332_32264 [Capsicum chinense]